MIDHNRKQLDLQHDRWLEPPGECEPECEVCGDTEFIELTLEGYLCFSCEMSLQSEEEDGW